MLNVVSAFDLIALYLSRKLSRSSMYESHFIITVHELASPLLHDAVQHRFPWIGQPIGWLVTAVHDVVVFHPYQVSARFAFLVRLQAPFPRAPNGLLRLEALEDQSVDLLQSQSPLI